jgi:restriction system protein
VNSQQAFATLLSGVEAALKESLACHNTAALAGDFDAVEIEVERQRNLVSARNQLQTLQELWPGLVGEQQRPPEPPQSPRRRKRLPKGAKTPNKAFVLPILTVLEEMGGRETTAEVLSRVEDLMSDTLNEFDLGKLKNGQLRWHNTAQWARQDMKEAGLLADDAPRGVWEITELGRALLRKQGKSLEERKTISSPRDTRQTTSSSEGRPIFARYKKRRFEAILLPNHQVVWNGGEYSSPSSAASAVAGGTSINGWQFWRYVDDKGNEQLIDTLR